MWIQHPTPHTLDPPKLEVFLNRFILDIFYFPCEIVATISLLRVYGWGRTTFWLLVFFEIPLLIITPYFRSDLRYFGIVSSMSRHKQQPTRRGSFRQLQYLLDEGEGYRILDDRCSRISSRDVSWSALLCIINLSSTALFDVLFRIGIQWRADFTHLL